MAPRSILVREGAGNYSITMNNSTDAVKPGHIVTTEGEAARAVAWPDADGDNSTGVVGCAKGHDVDTAYAVGDMMPVYQRNSGAEVWVRVKTSAGAIQLGDKLMNDGATTANGLAILAADSATLLDTVLGVASMISADEANERWCKVKL